ncbi:hypothetical protein NIES23_64250 (plasmid) [Trichormus variabilis NIES-23]|uniref:Uncharacterized protein n=1 Tax=Trichormus variabilis NIES-23 TaxID=1973479 RepID=A0A1Z4KXP0_ANAVA|nr:hypothetical protein NIES23_64250 [Trichormus variabilis NIES-23]
MTTASLTTEEYADLYSKEFSRQEAADELGISMRTLQRYLSYASQLIPALRVFVDENGSLNRVKIEAHHIEYLREVVDLHKSFSPQRVTKILTRKYLSEI